MRDVLDSIQARRLRRLRRTPAVRAMRRETRVHPAELTLSLPWLSWEEWGLQRLTPTGIDSHL